MKILLLALFGCAAFGTAFAQQATDLATLAEARQARVELAADIVAGRRDSGAALAALKQRIAAQRQSGDTDLAQGQAAVEIGERILNSAAPEKSAEIFRAAEVALTLFINRASDPSVKALAFIRRAQVRSQYLNKKTEAAADIKQAAALRPDDAYIKSWSELLRRRDATALQTQR